MTGNKHWRRLGVVFLAASGWICSGQAIAADPAATQAVSVTDYDTVSLNVQNTDLAQVLQLLSIQGRRNIVPSSQVSGSVTANLYDVTFREALDAILQQNGAGYREKGDFIYIYTLDELRKIQAAERTTTHVIFRLNYITAADASTFVTPLLSSAGSIAISGDPGPGFQPTMSDGGANSFAHADTMIVNDYPENIEAIKKVIGELDTRPKQVLVEATILKADLTEDMAFGVDFSIITDLAIDAFTEPLSVFNDLIDGTVNPPHNTGGITSTVGNAAEGAGGLKVGIITNNVAAFIRALDSVTDTTVIANPKILALNRQRADVLVGEKIGYLSTTATATATTQTVEFLDTGTQLTLRPFVSDDGFIRLELKPQISTARIRDVVPGTTTAAVTIPDEVTQELTTNIMVYDGQTIVLGGLFKEETSISRNQIPLLGDVPIAGAAFKGRDDNLTRSEVIFLITPHIVRDQALYAAGDSTMDSVEMMRVGTRRGLLPWARSKMTAAHLRDALESLEEGDQAHALWEVDMALGLEPTQIEAIRLKEKLTGERAYWPSQSMLEESIDLMVERVTDKRKERTRPMIPDPRNSEPGADDEPLDPPPAKPQPKPVVEPFDEVQSAVEPEGEQAQAEAASGEVSPSEVTPSEAGMIEATFVEMAEEGSASSETQTASIEIVPQQVVPEATVVKELFGADGAELQDSIPPKEVSQSQTAELWIQPVDTPALEEYESVTEQEGAPPVEPEVAQRPQDFAIREDDETSLAGLLIQGMGLWFDGEDKLYPTNDATTNVPVNPADEP